MELPADVSLPFIAYGIFKPGELAFLRLKPFVDKVSPFTIRKQLMVRDGVPILNWQHTSAEGTDGFAIAFRKSDQMTAYKAIVDLEPDHQYRWELIDGPGPANILVGRSPEKGSVQFDRFDGGTQWQGEWDPLFTVALEVVEQTLAENSDFQGDLKPLMRLQMAYLLLWSAIERYGTLRYSMGDNPMSKINRIGTESTFATLLATTVSDKRSIQRADRPTDKVTLDPENPKGSMLYYYQVRSNVTHAGKGIVWDHDTLRKSLKELLLIFRAMLSTAFKESQWPQN
jgi:hypothetical protein